MRYGHPLKVELTHQTSKVAIYTLHALSWVENWSVSWTFSEQMKPVLCLVDFVTICESRQKWIYYVNSTCTTQKKRMDTWTFLHDFYLLFYFLEVISGPFDTNQMEPHCPTVAHSTRSILDTYIWSVLRGHVNVNGPQTNPLH